MHRIHERETCSARLSVRRSATRTTRKRRTRMSTINDWPTVRALLENDGEYEGDPRASAIWSYYSTLAKHKVWKVYWPVHVEVLQESDWVKQPKLLWSSAFGLTKEGREEL